MSEEINHHRGRFSGTAAITIAAAERGMFGSANSQCSNPANATKLIGEATAGGAGELPTVRRVVPRPRKPPAVLIQSTDVVVA
jgi:hypothetical protein